MPWMLWIVLLAGCVGQPGAETVLEAPFRSHVGDPRTPTVRGYAPPPFSADEIRDAMRKGTVLVYRMTAVGQPPTDERWTVVDANAEGCTIHTAIVEPSTGAVIADAGAATSSWDDLRRHAEFEVKNVTLGTGTAVVPAGTFATETYTVVEGNETIEYHFAPEFPGPPVWMRRSVNGEPELDMALVSRTRD